MLQQKGGKGDAVAGEGGGFLDEQGAAGKVARRREEETQGRGDAS